MEFAISTLEAAAKIASSVIKPAGSEKLFPLRPGLAALLKHVNGLDDTKHRGSTIVVRDGFNLTLEGLRAGLAVLLADNPENKLDQLTKDAATSAAATNWNQFTSDCPKGRREMIGATSDFKTIAALNENLQEVVVAADRANLRAERDDLLAKFVGKKAQATWIGQFRWTPPARQANEVDGLITATTPLLVIAKNGGITSFGTEPEMRPNDAFMGKSIHNDTLYTVVLHCESAIPSETTAWQKLLEEREKHGWHYRIPAQGRVTLRTNGRVVANRRAFIAQHGCVAFVPATSYGQKVVSNVELDPTTGALKSVTHGGQAFDPALINRTGAAVAGVIDAEKAREKAEATANDPVTKLTRKKTLLQLQSDIEKLENPPSQ